MMPPDPEIPMTAPSRQTADQTGGGLPLPRLAVVMPCYNSERWIARLIGSVLQQDYPDLRVIAVDDGSTDGTLAALRACGDAITVETGPNRGACHARNRGLALAAGQGAEYVVFLDADDYFEGPILRHAAALAEQTGADLVVSDMDVVPAQGARTERRHYAGQIAPEALFAGFLKHEWVVPGGLLWRRTFVQQIGWDESLSRFQDADVVLRAMLRRPRIMKNDTGIIAYSTENTNSISRSPSRANIESQLQVMLDMLVKVPGTPFAASVPLVCQKLYKIARLGFQHGQPDLARQAMRAIVATGTQGAPWNWNWQMLVRLIGLQTRMRMHNP